MGGLLRDVWSPFLEIWITAIQDLKFQNQWFQLSTESFNLGNKNFAKYYPACAERPNVFIFLTVYLIPLNKFCIPKSFVSSSVDQINFFPLKWHISYIKYLHKLYLKLNNYIKNHILLKSKMKSIVCRITENLPRSSKFLNFL